MTNKANTYSANAANPTVKYSDDAKPNLAYCFSGGGSRALTCAWGQMLGLKTIDLLNKPRYISSVSGGTWATAIFNYLPEDITTDDLLGEYHPPESLALDSSSGRFDVNELGEFSLGQAPAGLGIDVLAVYGLWFLVRHSKSEHKWLWAYLVSKFILGPYGLRSEGNEVWNSTKSFSLSTEYAENNFPPNAPPLGEFYFLRSGRPFHIINDNIMESIDVPGKVTTNVIQIPNQVTPVSTGVRGQNPGTVPVGGGMTESYGFTSNLDQSDATVSPVDVTINQPYSLIDAVSTSSAFFAEQVASLIKTQLSDPDARQKLISKVADIFEPEPREGLLGLLRRSVRELASESISKIIEEIIEELDLLGSLNVVPSYNYWPIAETSSNTEMDFTDGGTLENTGILGAISQTDTGSDDQQPISLVVFDNTNVPLVKKNEHVIAAAQSAPLFGIDFDADTGAFQAFTEDQKDPTSEHFKSESLIAIFDNSADSSGKTPFEKLVQGLYATSGSAESPNFEAPYHQQTLTTIANPLANVSAGREVHMFYIQNAKILKWQNQIGDQELKSEIANGQEESAGTLADFKSFPYYSTFTKIGLEAKESQTLAQMWAWAIADDASPLKSALQEFLDA